MPKVTGCGEIEEIERGKVYRIRHHLGRGPETGRYLRSPKRTVHGTKSNARRALEEYRRELEEGFANPENLTVPELGWRWHEQRKLLKDLSPLTHATDECELRKVERWFGGILVSDLSLSLLNMVYSSMREDHGVSQRGVHRLNAVLSQVMDLAVKEHLVKHNPCRDVDVSRPRAAERTPLTLNEAIALCQALRSEGFDGRRVAVWLALATGVRRGEALGLTWRYVDFENRRIYIKYQYTRDKKLRETKNKRSRWIAVDDGTVAYLRIWRAVQARRMQVQGLAQAPDTPVCSDDAFGLHDPDNFSAWQRGYFVEHGLGRIEEPEEGGRKRRRYVGYDFHELRHAQATFLIGNGIDVTANLRFTVQTNWPHRSRQRTPADRANALSPFPPTAYARPRPTAGGRYGEKPDRRDEHDEGERCQAELHRPGAEVRRRSPHRGQILERGRPAAAGRP